VWFLAACESLTVIFFMFAAASVSTFFFVVIGSLSPVLVVLLAPRLKYRRLGSRETWAVFLAVAATTGALLLRSGNDIPVSLPGLLFTVTATVCSTAAILVAPVASRRATPLHLIWCMALVGCGFLYCC